MALGSIPKVTLDKKVHVLYLLDTSNKQTTYGEINRLIKQAYFDD